MPTITTDYSQFDRVQDDMFILVFWSLFFMVKKRRAVTLLGESPVHELTVLNGSHALEYISIWLRGIIDHRLFCGKWRFDHEILINSQFTCIVGRVKKEKILNHKMGLKWSVRLYFGTFFFVISYELAVLFLRQSFSWQSNEYNHYILWKYASKLHSDYLARLILSQFFRSYSPISTTLSEILRMFL